MKIVFLDFETMGEDITQNMLFDKFEEFGELYFYSLSRGLDIKERIKEANIVITNKCKITKDLLDGAVNLKLICVCATGYDNIDIDECKKRGIAVCNLCGYSTDSVAQTTVAMVLSLAEHLISYNRYVHNGTYASSGKANYLLPVYHEISGMTWGIVGCGTIGMRVAHIAKAFGANVVGCSKGVVAGIKNVDIDELCRISDIITLHVQLTNETKHMINEKRIETMKKNVIIVNVARGAVVDEAAVSRAVIDGRIGGFGVDVYDKEPIARNSPYVKLYGMDNVIFTPHMAWGACEARIRGLKMVRDNIASFLRGEKLNRVV